MRRIVKLNSHVTYWNAARKPRPAIVTGFATDTNPILRVGHAGEVYGNGAVGVPYGDRTASRCYPA
jgi:hypothetical protein